MPFWERASSFLASRRRGALFFLLLAFAVIVSLAISDSVYAGDILPSGEEVFMFLAKLFLGFAQGLGQIIVALIEVAIVPLLQYNKFSTSEVVSAGWTITRDAINMFFVVILIVIALGTILGSNKYSWESSVPRLLIFAVIINFSKTLCGLMIDISQIFTLTFVNALKDIAGGNFVTFLGLSQILSTSPTAMVTGGEAAKGFEYFASAVAAVFMMLFVFAMMCAMVAILAYRIVMLWVLVAVAPLAWFVGGAKGVIGAKGYEQWWSNFKCMLAVGPIISFFLWLSLSVAGAGSIAATEGFISGAAGATHSSSLLMSIFDLPHLTSFIIGMALMYTGMKTVSDYCSGTDVGFINKAVGMGSAFTAAGVLGGQAFKGLGGAIGNIPLLGSAAKRLGLTGGKGGAAATAAVLGGLATGGVLPAILAGGAVLGGAAGAKKLVGTWGGGKGKPGKVGEAGAGEKGTGVIGAGRAAGGAGLGGAAAVYARRTEEKKIEKLEAKATAASSPKKALKYMQEADALRKKRADRIAASGAGAEGASTEAKLAYLAAAAKNGKKSRWGKDNERAAATLAEVMGDPKAVEKLTQSGEMARLYQRYGSEIAALSSGPKGEKIKAFETSNPQLTGKAGEIDTIEDVKKLSVDALKDQSVRDRLKSIVNEKGENALDLISGGKLGQKRQEALASAVSVPPVLDEPEVAGPSRIVAAGQRAAERVSVARQRLGGITQRGFHGMEMSETGGITVTNPQKFQDFIAKNPSFLGGLSKEQMQQSPDAVRLAGAGLAGGGLKKAVKQIKKDPSSDQSADLRKNIKIALDAAAGRDEKGEVSDTTTMDAMKDFEQQMKSVDIGVAHSEAKKEDKFRTKEKISEGKMTDRTDKAGKKLTTKVTSRMETVQESLGDVRAGDTKSAGVAAKQLIKAVKEAKSQISKGKLSGEQASAAVDRVGISRGLEEYQAAIDDAIAGLDSDIENLGEILEQKKVPASKIASVTAQREMYRQRAAKFVALRDKVRESQSDLDVRIEGTA